MDEKEVMKTFLIRMMPETTHDQLKIQSAMRRTSMNDLILQAIDTELNQVEEMKHLLRICYQFIKGGPANELESLLKKYAVLDDRS